MGIDWFSSHKPLEYKWNNLRDGITLWVRTRVLPKGIKQYSSYIHEDGYAVVYVLDNKPCTYLSFRASSYPSLTEKVNIITSYLIRNPDSEYISKIERTAIRNPEIVNRLYSGLNFFSKVLGTISNLLPKGGKITIGGSMEKLNEIGSYTGGVIYFKDFAYTECKWISELFNNVSNYCKELYKDANSRELKEFYQYYIKYFRYASNFMYACYSNKVRVRCSY